LDRIDSNIVASYYAHSLQTIPSGLNIRDKNEYVTRLLEVLEIQAGEDGELYARLVKDLFGKSDAALLGEDPFVLENAVEMVLLHIRNGEYSFSFQLVDSELGYGTISSWCFFPYRMRYCYGYFYG
jgi:hypothetical protein